MRNPFWCRIGIHGKTDPAQADIDPLLNRAPRSKRSLGLLIDTGVLIRSERYGDAAISVITPAVFKHADHQWG